MSEGVVVINDKGKFLRYHQTSGHGPNTYYAYQWVTMLSEATLCRSSNVLSKLTWKDGTPMREAVAEIPAEESRIVTLLRNNE